MMEHALKTLADFKMDAIARDPKAFEATEFPLLIEDLQHSLGALKVSCIRMERALFEENQRLNLDLPQPRMGNG